jgi:hypothetical protein
VTDAWGGSWGTSWGDAWGAREVVEQPHGRGVHWFVPVEPEPITAYVDATEIADTCEARAEVNFSAVIADDEELMLAAA